MVAGAESGVFVAVGEPPVGSVLRRIGTRMRNLALLTRPQKKPTKFLAGVFFCCKTML